MKCSTCLTATPDRGYKTCKPCIVKATARRRQADIARGTPRKRRHTVRMCSRCGANPKQFGRRNCAACIHEREVIARRKPYVPLDQRLAVANVLMLRHMRHFDWVSAAELYVAANVDGGRGSDAYSQALHRLFLGGYAERANMGAGVFGGHWYRITQSGRDAYALAITIELDVATDEEAGDVPWDWRREAA